MESKDSEDKNIEVKKVKHENDKNSIYRTKEILVSILIILLSNVIIYFYPLCTSYTKYYNYLNNIYSGGRNPDMEYANSIAKSNIDSQIRKDAFNILGVHYTAIREKSVSNFESLTYFFMLATLGMLISAVIVLKNHKDKNDNKRYIGIALLIAAIVSLIVCIVYGLYGYFFIFRSY